MLKEEKRLSDLENPHGKIRNDQFLKYALLDTFASHLKPAFFAIETERRAARELLKEENVAAVEVIPETWLEAAVDFRVHKRDGSSFLVEVKSLLYRGEDWEGFVAAFRDQIGKAGWQLGAQRKSSGDGGNEDRILVYLKSSAKGPLTEEQLRELRRIAGEVLMQRRFFFVKEVRVEQE